jgi:hypothetical protein
MSAGCSQVASVRKCSQVVFAGLTEYGCAWNTIRSVLVRRHGGSIIEMERHGLQATAGAHEVQRIQCLRRDLVAHGIRHADLVHVLAFREFRDRCNRYQHAHADRDRVARGIHDGELGAVVSEVDDCVVCDLDAADNLQHAQVGTKF